MQFLYRPPQLIRKIYPDALWLKKAIKPTIYLTFDDGPIPELTTWVLDTLKHYNIKATFFCVGENVKKNPEIFNRIKSENHQIGNHTYNHLNGWKASQEDYVKNIKLCQELTQTNLFRPPYGRLTKKLYEHIKTDYKIIYWDVLTHDYNQNLEASKCLQNTIKYSRNGSIVVFHDNIKATKNLQYVLPKYIEHFLKLNYTFATL